jgi:hypothetical protein
LFSVGGRRKKKKGGGGGEDVEVSRLKVEGLGKWCEGR